MLILNKIWDLGNTARTILVYGPYMARAFALGDGQSRHNWMSLSLS